MRPIDHIRDRRLDGLHIMMQIVLALYLPRGQTLERQFLDNRLLSNSQAWLPESRAAAPGNATA